MINKYSLFVSTFYLISSFRSTPMEIQSLKMIAARTMAKQVKWPISEQMIRYPDTDFEKKSLALFPMKLLHTLMIYGLPEA